MNHGPMPALPLIAAGLGATPLGATGCHDDCVRGTSVLQETLTDPPSSTCGAGERPAPGPGEVAQCDVAQCALVCPELRFDDGRPIPVTGCTHTGPYANGAGGSGGTAGGGGGAGAAASGGAAGAAGSAGSATQASGHGMYCTYLVESDFCVASQQPAR